MLGALLPVLGGVVAGTTSPGDGDLVMSGDTDGNHGDAATGVPRRRGALLPVGDDGRTARRRTLTPRCPRPLVTGDLPPVGRAPVTVPVRRH